MAYNNVKDGVDKIKRIKAGIDVQTISSSLE
jgi:hypothetical protein